MYGRTNFVRCFITKKNDVDNPIVYKTFTKYKNASKSVI